MTKVSTSNPFGDGSTGRYEGEEGIRQSQQERGCILDLSDLEYTFNCVTKSSKSCSRWSRISRFRFCRSGLNFCLFTRCNCFSWSGIFEGQKGNGKEERHRYREQFLV